MGITGTGDDGGRGEGGREGDSYRKICFWPDGGRKVFGGRGPSLSVRGGMVVDGIQSGLE